MTRTTLTSGALLPLLLVLPGVAAAASTNFDLTVAAGKHDRTNTPVRVALTDELGDVPPPCDAIVRTPEGRQLVAQITGPGLLAAKGTRAELHFVLPSLKAGQTASFRVTAGDDLKLKRTPMTFRWHDTAGEYAELQYDKRPVLRYMYKAIDETSPQTREQTYKVYHHLFHPAREEPVTKGPGGLYTHHRGLFYGFNRISYTDAEGKKQSADTWHCRGDAHLSHEGFLASEAGPVLGRHRVRVDWHGPGKKVFATEEREMTAWHTPGGTLVEFASRLVSTVGPVRLDGDPQHAGFQFRASNEVASQTKGQTYYLRPDGKGAPGETRNWAAKSPNPACVNLPWHAMSFVLGDQRYTAAYLDRPQNPKEARYSERDYGRFGSYFEYDLAGADGKGGEPRLDLNYRLWLQAGELTAEDVQRLSTDFVEPMQTEVKRG